jgi:hypothetical protein
VITVACGVAIREDKWLFVAVPHALECFCIVVNFVEKSGKVHRMTLGATASIIVAVHRIRNMRLVIVRVRVLAIPAGRELVISH